MQSLVCIRFTGAESLGFRVGGEADGLPRKAQLQAVQPEEVGLTRPEEAEDSEAVEDGFEQESWREPQEEAPHRRRLLVAVLLGTPPSGVN